MDLETFLLNLKSLFSDILISGVKYIPMSLIKKLNIYNEKAKNYNLLVLDNLIRKFIEETTSRSKIFVDISIYLDIAILEYEGLTME